MGPCQRSRSCAQCASRTPCAAQFSLHRRLLFSFCVTSACDASLIRSGYFCAAGICAVGNYAPVDGTRAPRCPQASLPPASPPESSWSTHRTAPEPRRTERANWMRIASARPWKALMRQQRRRTAPMPVTEIICLRARTLTKARSMRAQSTRACADGLFSRLSLDACLRTGTATTFPQRSPPCSWATARAKQP